MIKFDLSTLLVFLSGLLIGFLIFVLIYLYAVLKSLSRKVKIKNVEEEDIDEQEIRWLIIDAQKTFNDKNIRNNEGYGALLLRLIKELTNDIASKFYPNSRNPYLELTIDETIILANYISVRFDELMSRRILKLFRGMTVNQLLFVKTTKDSIEGHKIVKQFRKHRVTSILKGALATINLANPL